MDVHPSTIIGERLKGLYLDRGVPLSDHAQEWCVKMEHGGYRVKLVVRLPSGRYQKFFIRKRVFRRVQLAKLYVADRAMKSGVLDFIDSEKRIRRGSGGPLPARSKRPFPSFDTCPDFIPLESDSESEYESGSNLGSKPIVKLLPPASPTTSLKKSGKPRLLRYFHWGEY